MSSPPRSWVPSLALVSHVVNEDFCHISGTAPYFKEDWQGYLNYIESCSLHMTGHSASVSSPAPSSCEVCVRQANARGTHSVVTIFGVGTVLLFLGLRGRVAAHGDSERLVGWQGSEAP